MAPTVDDITECSDGETSQSKRVYCSNSIRETFQACAMSWYAALDGSSL